jgi:hypothetical protein
VMGSVANNGVVVNNIANKIKMIFDFDNNTGIFFLTMKC